MKTSAQQRRLFEFLKQREAASKTFTIAEAASVTGLSEASIKTYVSKKMKDRWVFPTDGAHFEVKGFSAIPIAEFERIMSQKGQAQFQTVAEFRDQIEETCRQGVAKGYDVKAVLKTLIEKF